MYVIKKKHITEPRYSIDGKRHTRTFYYSGSHSLDEDDITVFTWSNRNNAVLFNTREDADSVRKLCGGSVIEVKKRCVK